MARKLKPYPVSTVTLGQRSIEVMFDRNQKDFFAAIEKSEVRDPTEAGCREKAEELLRQWRPTAWEQRIVVEIDKPKKSGVWGNRNGLTVHEARVSFSFYRYERATTFDGKTLEREHTADFEENVRRAGKFNSPSMIRRRESLDDTHHYWQTDSGIDLEYSDTLWDALVALAERMRGLHGELYRLLSSERVVEALCMQTSKLLPAMPKEP